MEYQGVERRRHRVYITHNTEYHLRDNVCVAVRDRRSQAFRSAHAALNLKLEGGVKIRTDGARVPTLSIPAIGDAIFFTQMCKDREPKQVVTSRVERIERPSRRDILLYPPSRVR